MLAHRATDALAQKKIPEKHGFSTVSLDHCEKSSQEPGAHWQ